MNEKSDFIFPPEIQENQVRILELQAYIQLDAAIRQAKITGTWLSWIME